MGTYDEFPKDGVIVAVEKDLRKQIQDTMAQACRGKGFSQECHDALVPLLYKTDLAAHTKRFVVIGGTAVISLVMAVIALVYEMGRVANTDVPSNIKLNNNDLVQIQSMSGASTIAAVAAEPSAKPYTVALQPSATTTSPNVITIETLQASKDGHNAGDVVYRLFQVTADRIGDFPTMTGGQEAQKTCQGQTLRRADTVEACIQSIERLAMNLANDGPDNLLPVAQQNVPVRPAPGQHVAVGVANLTAEGVPLIVPLYRVVYEHAPRRPNFDLPFSPLALATSAAAIAITTLWVLYIPQSLTEVWIDGEKILVDLNEDKLSCPKNILCAADECLGQAESKSTIGQPYCKKYEWLEELIKRAAMPPFEPKCDGGEQKLIDASKKFGPWVETVCKDHQTLDTSFDVMKNDIEIDSGWSSQLNFDKKGGAKCLLSCSEFFMTFADAGTCISDTGISKTGSIESDCEKAYYVTYHRTE
ncbi:hypothetical protein EK21DRAFT_118998 [Setomelanomma holmii]|uniref:Uncharacterized protein n=1 Tax=Setomelanomma holmii TaxID=210430 RepID=A0A9P4LGH6_9PLEO|nr:hypothetical protein EK21DRAFT_118998 [Setomelanomma holmii]